MPYLSPSRRRPLLSDADAQQQVQSVGTSQNIHARPTGQYCNKYATRVLKVAQAQNWRQLKLCIRQHCLKLGFLLLLECVHGLEQTKSICLNCFYGFVLLITFVLVLLLKAFNECFEVCLCLLHFGLLIFDQLLAGIRRKLLKLFDLGLFIRIAQVQVGRTTLRAQSVGEFFEICELSTTLVILQIIWVTILDCRVAPNPYLVAFLFASCRAIDVRDQNCLGIFVFSRQLIPIWLHALAMSSPRR